MAVETDVVKTVQQWFIYIIEVSDGSLYTGVTTDVERRFNEHCSPARGARYFRGRKPIQVVYTEQQPDRGSALRREAEIKKLSRDEKLELIGGVIKKAARAPLLI